MSNIENSTDSFFERFYALLVEERELLSEILLLERGKSVAFGKSNGFIDLDYYNEKLEFLLCRQDELEGRRLGYLGEFSMEKGLDFKCLRDIWDYIPEGLRLDYSVMELGLKGLIDEIKCLSASNGVIIQDSLKLIAYGLSVFREEQSLEINYKERDESSIRYKPVVIDTVI